MTPQQIEQLFTIRWYIKNKYGTAEAKEEILELLGELLGEKTPKEQLEEEPEEKEEEKDSEPDRPNKGDQGAKDLWVPGAVTTSTKMRTRGSYRKKYPEGLIVHFHAGRRDTLGKSSNNTTNWGASQGYNYLTMTSDGTIFQSTPLDKWGYHAGKSYWKGLGSSVSKYLVGVEVEAAGKLTKTVKGYKSWFGKYYSDQDVRYSSGEDNIVRGYYHKFTNEQERSLIELILWLKHNNPDVFDLDLVLGHDEVSPNRKNDPGASLSMTMPEFRDVLKREYAART